MTFEEFVSRLQGAEKQSDGSYMAKCPAHGDDNPSLHVSRGQDGRILLKCFSGCSAEAVVEAMGLKLADLMPVKNAERPERTVKGRWGKWVCDYNYEDENGVVIYKSSRYVKDDGRKTFVMKHPDPSAPYGWAFGLSKANVTRVPFRLPRVIEAAKAGRIIVFAEGEKDVLNLERLGLTATCNVGGAGKWAFKFPEDWGRWFEGAKKILIIADNDPELDKNGHPFAPGQRHAWDVRTKLVNAGVTAQMKLMVMPQVEGQKHVKDFTDWFEARQAAGLPADIEAFQEAVKDAPEWPAAWRFDTMGGLVGEENDDDLGGTDVADAEKSVGDSASVSSDAICGRFGELLPRSPDRLARTYRVDFRIGGEFTVPIDMSWKEIFYRWQKTKANGEKVLREEWRECTLPMMLFWSRKMVEMVMGQDAKLSARLQSELQAVVTLLWLRSRGKFFWDDSFKSFSSSLYFDEKTGILMKVRSDEFVAFVATSAEINRESTGFKYLMSMIDDAALSDDASEGVIPSNCWDKKDGVVYVSSGDSEMYRIKDGKVDRVQNGTDGIVFMRGKTLKPWQLQEGPGKDPFACAEIFQTATWADPHGWMNMRLWVLNLFFCHDNKPIMLIHGPAQTGKTRLASTIKQILGVQRIGGGKDGKPDKCVNTIDPGDKGCEQFWVSINDGRFEIFDNVDDNPPDWVSTAFQTASTGGEKKIRRLYSNDEIKVLSANANIVFTSNDPKFITCGKGGMSDRVVSIGLESDPNRKSEDEKFTLDVIKNRNEYMTFLIRTVAAALVDDKPVDESINRRHPDYGRFSVKCGRAFGDEPSVIRALSATETNKALLPLRQNAITRAILDLLKNQSPPWVMQFQAKAASTKILAMLGSSCDEESAKIYSSRKIGIAFSSNLRQFRQLLKISDSKKLHGDNVWDIDGLTPGGEAALGGKVDLKPHSAESPMQAENVGTLLENAPTNPPNPPNADDGARAPAPISSFNDVKKEENIEEDNDNEEWSFDL